MANRQLIQQLKLQGISHPGVLRAIEKVPREKFVLPKLKQRAYENVALPIDKDQTISQPYVVALMTQALIDHPNPRKILEIGTGSGYQAAVLGTLFPEIWTIERIEVLYHKAKKLLYELGFSNVHCRLGDGVKGYVDEAPFDGILVTAATPTLPLALLEQLHPQGGRLVIPLGPTHQVQELTLIIRQEDKFEETILEQVCFVPLIPDHH
ncbi:MAG: protein-L-isoaspartate(D-aspartate) O-methyltransferase [Proteobacteria bacterium]|nr:protein-L-isoaspartate(D-aspartate) O-methyltransferase [Pseudomonadota bacterium]